MDEKFAQVRIIIPTAMLLIDIFGALAVSLMALFYALEERAPIFILLFSLACFASSIYAVAIQSWPFAIIEFVWCGIALRRWHQIKRNTLT